MSDNDVQPETAPAPEADAEEQRRPVVESNGSTDRSEADPEEPDLPAADLPQDIPNEADPADAYEQTLAVEYDEDDYR